MAIDRAVVDVGVLPVCRVDQLVPRLHHAGPGCKRLDQQELRDRELDIPPTPRALVLGLIKRQVAPRHDAARRRARALGATGFVAAQQCPDALDQQPLAERLRNVVVGATPQAHQLVDLLVLAGEEDDRHVASHPQPLQQLHAVHARHLDVQYRQVDGLGDQALQRTFPVRVGPDQEAFLLQGHRH